MKRTLISVAVVTALALITTASLLRSGRSSKGAEAYVEQVERRTITKSVRAGGRIDPRVRVNVSAHVVARIEKIYAREGERIEAGQPFIELEKETFTAVHQRARAALEIARSNELQAKIDLDDANLKMRRMERLAGEQIAARERLEEAQLALDSAELQVRRAGEAVLQSQADLEKARDDLAKTTIYAPISGRVIVLNAEQGEVVVSGTMHNQASVIGVIADLSEILVEVDVDETDIVDVDKGQTALIEVDAIPQTRFGGRVVEVGEAGYSQTNRPDVTFFKVKILLEDADARLLSGMTARALIEVETRTDQLVVPIESVVFRPPLDQPQSAEEGEVIFLFEDGEAVQQPVELGISDITHVEIRSGISDGASVVTGPQRLLRELENGDPLRLHGGDNDGGASGADEDGDGIRVRASTS